MARPEDSRPAGRATEPSLAWLGEHAVTLADIWATVEIERALTDLGRSGVPPSQIAGPVDDPLLGARVVVLSAADRDIPIALAEPSSEGRLAATLARHGEGPAGRYVRAAMDLDMLRDLAAGADISISRPSIGPFGAAVLLLTSVAGPHLVLVGPSPDATDPAVPSPP